MHTEYGRNDLPRKVVCSIFDLTCKEMCAKIGINNFTIAYSRPNNIKDLVTKSKLHMVPGKEASKYYKSSPCLLQSPASCLAKQTAKSFQYYTAKKALCFFNRI